MLLDCKPVVVVSVSALVFQSLNLNHYLLPMSRLMYLRLMRKQCSTGWSLGSIAWQLARAVVS
ncbi:MAG: hypothetical protein ABI413_01865 [Ktedonobacteraceae bacterium]